MEETFPVAIIKLLSCPHNRLVSLSFHQKEKENTNFKIRGKSHLVYLRYLKTIKNLSLLDQYWDRETQKPSLVLDFEVQPPFYYLKCDCCVHLTHGNNYHMFY